MSYDIYLVDSHGEVIHAGDKHQISGGTYTMDGTTECWINITYNYAKHYHRVFGEKGIRTIYGMNAMDSIPVILDAMKQLGDETSENYWEPTEGNAKEALKNLIRLALLAPEGVWSGD